MRLHSKQGFKTKEFVSAAKDFSILIIEGTRTSRDEDVNVSENEEYENCLRVVEEEKKMVIADFSPRNFERLEIFKDIADKTSRQLVITAKDVYMLHSLEMADGIDRMRGLRIYRELRDKKDKWETEVVMDRWEDRYVDPVEIRNNPHGFIVCFSFYDMKHLLDIKPEGGAYIYSASEAFSEEQKFDFIRLYKWLRTFNFKIHGFEMNRGESRLIPIFHKGFHTSGHLSAEDIVRVVDEIDPEILIPVHTDNSSLFKENFEKTKILRNGEHFEI